MILWEFSFKIGFRIRDFFLSFFCIVYFDKEKQEFNDYIFMGVSRPCICISLIKVIIVELWYNFARINNK